MSNRIKPGFFHSSAVQGSREARTELYTDVQRRSTGAADAVMCRESAGQPALLDGRADGGGVW